MESLNKIAWLGLGNMGLPMARNASKRGYSITAYNRTNKDVDLASAVMVSSVEEAVQDADAVCIMVSDGAAVEDLLFGDGNAVEWLKQGAVVVNMSTIGVSEAKSFAMRLANEGAEWLDAPVSGSVGPATEGSLVFLVGGQQATYERLKPFLASMGKESFFLGPVSSGAAMKLLVNAYLGVAVEAASECMALADKAGLDRMKYLEVLKETGVWSPLLAGKQEMWRDDEYPAAFALKHMAKDMGLVSEFSRTLTASTPTLSNTLQVYLSALANDLAEFDMSGVFRETSRLAGSSHGSRGKG